METSSQNADLLEAVTRAKVLAALNNVGVESKEAATWDSTKLDAAKAAESHAALYLQQQALTQDPSQSGQSSIAASVLQANQAYQTQNLLDLYRAHYSQNVSQAGQAYYYQNLLQPTQAYYPMNVLPYQAYFAQNMAQQYQAQYAQNVMMSNQVPIPQDSQSQASLPQNAAQDQASLLHNTAYFPQYVMHPSQAYVPQDALQGNQYPPAQDTSQKNQTTASQEETQPNQTSVLQEKAQIKQGEEDKKPNETNISKNKPPIFVNPKWSTYEKFKMMDELLDGIINTETEASLAKSIMNYLTKSLLHYKILKLPPSLEEVFSKEIMSGNIEQLEIMARLHTPKETNATNAASVSNTQTSGNTSGIGEEEENSAPNLTSNTANPYNFEQQVPNKSFMAQTDSSTVKECVPVNQSREMPDNRMIDPQPRTMVPDAESSRANIPSSYPKENIPTMWPNSTRTEQGFHPMQESSSSVNWNQRDESLRYSHLQSNDTKYGPYKENLAARQSDTRMPTGEYPEAAREVYGMNWYNRRGSNQY